MAVLEDGQRLVFIGGWDGHVRRRSVHIYDAPTDMWRMLDHDDPDGDLFSSRPHAPRGLSGHTSSLVPGRTRRLAQSQPC